MNIYAPESVGMHSGRLDRIAPIMTEFVKDNQLPGIMTLIQRRGKVVHLGKFGMMDIEAGKPIQEDTIFRIYSMTKPIISVALMMLYEEGRFGLQDPVAKFIPAFAKTKVYDSAGVLGAKWAEPDPQPNLYHLLTHTAGLSYGWFFDSPVEEMYRQQSPIFKRDEPLSVVIEKIASLPLLFQPGTQWRYSYATDVLGYVIQVIADMPLADFLQERIFKPLGMVDTAFHVTADKWHRLAQLYTSQLLYNPVLPSPEEALLISDVTIPTQSPSGGGGLVSTLGDYLAFSNCLINQGKYDGGILIGRKTLAYMTANHIPEALMPLKIGVSPINSGFGLGFSVLTHLGQGRTLTSAGEYGWGGAARTVFWIDPAEDLIGLLMTQHISGLPYPVQERFHNLVYQAIVD